MRKLAILALGAAVSIGCAQTTAPERPTTPTTGPNTTGTPDTGARIGGEIGNPRQSSAPERDQTAKPPRTDHETGTPAAGSAATHPMTTGTPDTGSTAATNPMTTGHIPRTAKRNPRTGAATTATTHSGSTPIAADQSDVSTRDAAPASSSNGAADRVMPDTAAGWLPMLFSGSLLTGAGVSLRRRKR